MNLHFHSFVMWLSSVLLAALVNLSSANVEKQELALQRLYDRTDEPITDVPSDSRGISLALLTLAES